MLLNEKRGCFSFIFLIPALFILPINPEIVFNILNFFFGSPGDDGTVLFLKAGIWIILFAIVFGVSSKMFDKKGIATIFSMVFSLISIRFIPNQQINYIGQAYGILGIVFLTLFVIGATLFILNKYFPINEHKSFGVVWGLFYFFIAWCFHQLANLHLYQFPKIQETLEVIAPWGRVVSIVLGVACLMKALGGRSRYAREIPRRPERTPGRSGEEERLKKELEKERKQHREELKKAEEQRKKDVKQSKRDGQKRSIDMAKRIRRKRLDENLERLRNEKNRAAENASRLHSQATRAGWTRTKQGRDLYKKWYREYSKVVSLEKEIEQIEKRLGLR